jgi:ParB family chromosome partitioning protein
VVIGHRRLRAFRELYTDEPDRFHSIRCIVTDNQNITVRQLIENVQRTDLKPIELYHALKELKGQGLTIKQIADVIGKAEGYVKNLFSGIKEADADPQNLEILQKSHHVTLSVLQATRAVKNKAERKKLLLKAAEKKITQRELQHKVRAVKNKGKPPRIAALDLNVDRFLIKIKFNERYTFYKIAAEVKKTLKRHNIKIKGV